MIVYVTPTAYMTCLASVWPVEVIAPIFQRSGAIDPIPEHYEYIGITDDFFEENSVVGIRVAKTGFAVGDRIAFALLIDFVEEQVESIEEDKKSLPAASVGQYVGVTIKLTKAEARNGVSVFRVRPTA